MEEIRVTLETAKYRVAWRSVTKVVRPRMIPKPLESEDHVTVCLDYRNDPYKPGCDSKVAEKWVPSLRLTVAREGRRTCQASLEVAAAPMDFVAESCAGQRERTQAPWVVAFRQGVSLDCCQPEVDWDVVVRQPEIQHFEAKACDLPCAVPIRQTRVHLHHSRLSAVHCRLHSMDQEVRLGRASVVQSRAE